MADTKRAREGDDDSEPSESVSLDGGELLSRVVDVIDEQLFNDGMTFKDNMNWEEFGEELRDLLFRYYDDEGGDDDDYDPAAPADDEESVSEASSSSSGDEK